VSVCGLCLECVYVCGVLCECMGVYGCVSGVCALNFQIRNFSQAVMNIQ